jgi:RNA polymerase subunit RPABC4/transcription elongation factor Spt4
MSIENERVCAKCNRVLHDNEGFCSNCGKITVKPKKGTIIIKTNNALPLGICLILIGIGIILIISILLTNGINYNSSGVDGLYGLGFAFIVLGVVLIKKRHELIINKKAEFKNDMNSIYCKYCYTVLDEGSNYCYFCGSKIK